MVRRRYRLFTVCALGILFLLYRLVQNTWEDPVAFGKLQSTSGKQPPAVQVVPEKEAEPGRSGSKKEGWSEESFGQYDETDAKAQIPKPAKDKQDPVDVDISKGTIGTFKDVHGDKDVATPTFDEDDAVADKTVEKVAAENPLVLTEPPKDLEDDQIGTRPKSHWKKQKENFPVPKESVASLPSGEPKTIPRIQYKFDTEGDAAKATRVQRLKKVKAEIGRAWSGYRQFAWMHDELSPMSAQYKDPFCGWAATLVDSLDTLWIAGLKSEFEEAVKAVKNIDFTWTRKNEIPVFETTIRYLGGLLGAYDVSGGQYPILLDKAVELGEILFGVFDTPNRMPILYYNWRPEFASQPRLAGRVGIAELATLSMEFTRLAQLTKEDKYYDAVDRVTDALIDLQERGTAIPGLFPQGIDATGCNKTATDLRDSLSKAARDQLGDEDLTKKPKGYVPEVIDDDFLETSKAKRSNLEPRTPPKKPGEVRPDDVVEKSSEGSLWESQASPPYTAEGKSAPWDCVPQGLVPSGYGYQSYHMGGGQDSAYEYFPKEYLLLGGLESKYEKLHVDAIEAINEWLLYRPMSDDDWDVLFPAKAALDPNRAMDAEYEITHLTCFIGGMYGLGAKIFNREKDIETAIKLTDGCVWAYQLTASGLMPEVSRVLPCPTLEKCEFNQTLWWDTLDLARGWRERKMAEIEAKLKEDELNLAAGKEINIDSEDSHRPKAGVSEEEAKEAKELKKAAEEFKEESISDLTSQHRKRAVVPPAKLDADIDVSTLPDSLKKKLGIAYDTGAEDDSLSEQESTKSTSKEKESSSNADEEVPSVPKQNTPAKVPSSSNQSPKPLGHEEFVKDRIQKDRLPPGFTTISSRYYILR